MDLERARTIAAVAQTVINSAKVEVEFINATGSRGATGFIPTQPIGDRTSDIETPPRPRLAAPRV